MCMDSDEFIVFLTKRKILVSKFAHLFRINRTITVYDIDSVYRTLTEKFKCFVDVSIIVIGDGHDIDRRFIAFCMTIFDHFNRCRNRIDISSDSDQVDHTVALINDIAAKIGSTDICHHGNLHVGIVVADDTANVFFVTEFPWSKIFFIKNIFGCFVAELHIVNPGFDVSLV